MISIFRKLAAVSLRNSSLVLKSRCSQSSEIDVKPPLLSESINFCSLVLSTMLSNSSMIAWISSLLYLGLFLVFFNNLWTTYPPKYCSVSISLLVTDGGILSLLQQPFTPAIFKYEKTVSPSCIIIVVADACVKSLRNYITFAVMLQKNCSKKFRGHCSLYIFHTTLKFLQRASHQQCNKNPEHFLLYPGSNIHPLIQFQQLFSVGL